MEGDRKGGRRRGGSGREYCGLADMLGRGEVHVKECGEREGKRKRKGEGREERRRRGKEGGRWEGQSERKWEVHFQLTARHMLLRELPYLVHKVVSASLKDKFNSY